MRKQGSRHPQTQRAGFGIRTPTGLSYKKLNMDRTYMKPMQKVSLLACTPLKPLCLSTTLHSSQKGGRNFAKLEACSVQGLRLARRCHGQAPLATSWATWMFFAKRGRAIKCQESTSTSHSRLRFHVFWSSLYFMTCLDRVAPGSASACAVCKNSQQSFACRASSHRR